MTSQAGQLDRIVESYAEGLKSVLLGQMKKHIHNGEQRKDLIQ